MKLSAILITVACIQVAARTNGQTVTLNLKNAPIQKVFKEVSRQTGVSIVYAESLFRHIKPVSIQIKDATVQEVLDVCLNGQPFHYILKGKSIVISSDPNLKNQPIVNNEITALPPPPITVSGHVVNENHEGITASVVVKGTSNGVATDAQGYFTLHNVDENAILLISGVNIETIEVKIRGRTELSDITVKLKVVEGAEVKLLSTGYQKIQSERFVGSTDKLDSAGFHRRAGMDILSRLDGTIAGMSFYKKGGTAPIQIRGISTFGLRAAGSLPATDPLVIVDDFPFYGDLNNINPNDVEDITVLKDAAAASIWGTRAGNGVIVITTKKSKYNQPFRVNYSSNIGISAKPDLFYFPQMSSSDFIDVETFLFGKDFYNSQITNPKFNVISPIVDILDKKRKGLLTQDQSDLMISELRNVDVRNDYEKYIFRNQVQQQHYLNLSGGGNIYSYTLSLGFNNTLPTIKHTKPGQQFTINSTNIFRPLKNLEFTLGVGLSKNTLHASSFSYPINVGGGKTYLYPYASLADVNGKALAVVRDYASIYTDTAGAGKLLDWKYRPLDEIRFADDERNSLFGRINLGLAYKLTSWLKADIQYQYILQNGENRNLQGIETYSTRNQINRFTNLNQTAPNLRNPLPIGGILDVSSSTARNYNFRTRLSFNKKLAEGHELNAFAATDVSELRGNSNNNRFYGYDDNIGAYSTGLDHITNFTLYSGLGSGRILQSSGIVDGATTRFVSISANANYTFLKRYNFYVSGRRDGANVFGANTNNKWKPLWSTGLSWEVSKEKFYDLAWMHYLRVRATYGYTGNVDNARSALPTISYSLTPQPLTNLVFATIGNAPNPDLKWEEVRTTNVGIDFSMLKDRLAGSVDLYQKQSRDIITTIPFDASTGVPSFVVNAANLRARGIELRLNAVPVQSGSFKWMTSFALAYNKTIVTKFYNGGFRTNQFTLYGVNPSEGRIAFGISSYRWAGLDPLTGDPRGYLNSQVSTNYTTILNDSVKNQVFHGSSIPLYTGFLNNTLTWKQFSLSTIIRYYFDYYFRKPSLNYTNLFNSWSGHNDYAKRWKGPGDEAITNIPSMSYPSNNRRDEFFQNSEVNVLRGDHIRLQDIRLSYNWNNKKTSDAFIQSAQLFAYANNLNVILWRANKEKLDPEYTGGSSGLDLPAARSWTFGINIGF